MRAFCTGVIDTNSGIGSHPDAPVAVFTQCRDVIVTRNGILHGYDTYFGAVVTIQSILRPEPHESHTILQNRQNRIVRQSVISIQRPESRLFLFG